MRKINFIIGVLLLCVSIVTVCFSNSTKGSGVVSKKTVEVKYFNNIKLNGSATVILTKGSKEVVTIETDENLIELISTEVKNNILTINEKSNINPSKLFIYVTFKDISTLELNGSGEFQNTNTLSSDDLTLAINGSGNMNFANLNVEFLHAYIAGTGNIHIQGNGNKAIYAISGSGNIIADSLSSSKAIVKSDGSGDCRLFASEELKVVISGSGTVHYRGDPVITQDIVGSGSLIKIKKQ
jgi:hypothetical protein